MLTEILQGQCARRFNMVTAVTDAWERSLAYRRDHAAVTDNTSIDGLVWRRHSYFNQNKPISDRVTRGYSIRSIEDGWIWFADADPDKKLSLKKHMELLNIPSINEADMILLTIESSGFTTPKGELIYPETFNGWLFDPKNHFWS
ncbi:hypothetical protein [Pseudomonas phage D6]|nr:hypothetical protein [Pseudomonas phage D6]